MKSWRAGHFRGSAPTLYDAVKWTQVITHLSKPTDEHQGEPYENYGCWEIVTCPRRFMDCNKWATWAGC